MIILTWPRIRFTFRSPACNITHCVKNCLCRLCEGSSVGEQKVKKNIWPQIGKFVTCQLADWGLLLQGEGPSN